MRKLNKDRGSVICGESAWIALQEQIEQLQPSQIFILVDENTHEHCLPLIVKRFEKQFDFHTLSISSGETHKTINTCLDLWAQLSAQGADRKSLLINLGGGVITDLGGFVASTYQRGIECINIPTSLLAMVDASIGGKNGVDLGNLKNQIGIIRDPLLVLIDPDFLNTLPKEHFESGVSEMLKHGLIADESYWEEITTLDGPDHPQLEALIWRSIQIKNEIVTLDPKENGARKALNYGHTLGHAIESYCLEQDDRPALLHGEAIAIGMVLACYLSQHLTGLSSEVTQRVKHHIVQRYSKQNFTDQEILEITALTKHDKKNKYGKVLFVLLEDIGKYKLDQEVSEDLIKSAFQFYMQS
ncbi:MAG: 3-dehydroquinate synthase [Flavobacteriaceae bacterium]|nr:3-dehydroquinate synthase [Flavobacteriaceae bacterium]